MTELMTAPDALHSEKILSLEFEYARETAAQAQNDRTVVVNLYLILVGAVGSLLLAIPTFAGDGKFSLPSELIGGLFIIIASVGFLTLFKLIRLRQAWHSSALAMNAIKNYYLQRFPELETALHWRTHTIPARDKWWTISFILSLMIVLIDSAALMAGVYLLQIRTGLPGIFLGLIVGLLFFFLQAIFYFYQLGGGEMQGRPDHTQAR